MAKKMFKYLETITFVVDIAAENQKEAMEAGTDFVEGILDHADNESTHITGLRGFEIEPMGGANVEEE